MSEPRYSSWTVTGYRLAQQQGRVIFSDQLDVAACSELEAADIAVSTLSAIGAEFSREALSIRRQGI